MRSLPLDGLRGLAALAVVLSHVAAMTYVPWGGVSPTHLQFALWHLGAPAVDLFFVLSGFVVARSLGRGRGLLPYLWRRWVRLAPVAYVAVALAVVARLAARHAPEGFSVLVTDELRAPLTTSDLLGALTLGFPPPDANHLNPPLWTLIVEMQVALLMPLFARLGRWPLSLILVGALCVWTGFNAYYYALFYPLFLLGAVLARHPVKLPSAWARAALVGGLLALLQRHLTGSDDPLTRYLTAPGAALMLLGTLNGAGHTFLTLPPVQWLGRVSFSLYATHFPVMLSVSVLLARLGVPVLLGAALSVPLCLAVAELAYRLVDGPVVAYLARTKARARPGPAPA